jgi:hypothetical protein
MEVPAAASAQRPLIMTAPFGLAAGALLNYVRILDRGVWADGVFAGFVAIAGVVVPVGKTDANTAAFLAGGGFKKLLAC